VRSSSAAYYKYKKHRAPLAEHGALRIKRPPKNRRGNQIAPCGTSALIFFMRLKGVVLSLFTTTKSVRFIREEGGGCACGEMTPYKPFIMVWW